MKRTLFLIILASILLAVGIMVVLSRANSAQPDSDSGPVILGDGQAKYPLGLHLQVLEDPSRKLTIQEVSSPAYNTRFVPSRVLVPNYGYTDSAYWVRLNIDNLTKGTTSWLLDVAFPNVFYVDLYIPLPDGKGFAVKQSGVLRPPQNRDVIHSDIIFQLSIPNNTSQTIYLRFESGSSMTLALTLWNEQAFFKTALPSFWIQGLLYGALIGLLLYNAFILISVQDPTYIYLVVFLASFLLWLGSYDGYTELFLFKNIYYLKPYYFPLFFGLFWIAIVLFGDSLLELKSRLPIFHRIAIFSAAIWGLSFLMVPWVHYGAMARLMLVWAVFTSITIMVAGIILWKQRYLAIQLFMIAAFGYLVSTVLTILVRLGTLPSNFFTENGFRFGVVWLAVFWSITLASRINQMKAETENANRNLQNSEQRLSQILDSMPLGVVLYGHDHTPKYTNRRTVEILSNPNTGVGPDLSIGRTDAQVIEYYSLKMAGSLDPYPLENFPVYTALKGQQAHVDDVEIHEGGRAIPLELWASPIIGASGKVESAVLVFQDIGERRLAESELMVYRKMLELLVEKRTAEVTTINRELRLRLDWLAAVNLVNQMVARSADFSQIHIRIVEIIKHLFENQDAFIAELDAENRQLKIMAHSACDLYPGLLGSSTSLPERFRSLDTQFEPGSHILIAKDEFGFLSGPMGEHIQSLDLQSIAFVPLQVREHVLGFLGLEMHEAEKTITEEEANLLSIFSTDIAQLIEDARLFEQAKLLVATEERNRLARELHDSVAQALYSISLFINATRLALEANKPEVVRNHLEELTQLSREAMHDMRLLIFELRPPILEKSGLAAALQSRLESVEAKAGFEAHFESKGVLHLTPAQEGELYRIAQEALNNITKHAQASQVNVRLTGQDGCVSLTIEDNGIGFDPLSIDHGGGQGFRNMRERAANIGARCSFESVPGQGTKITIEVNE